MLKDVTAIIKTFNRPQCLEHLLESIQEYYPTLKIMIIDDGKGEMPKTKLRDVQYYKIPFDSGLSAGRNYALGLINTPYFLLLDDDFIFTGETRIELLLKYLQEGDFDIMGGLVRNMPDRIPLDYYGTLVLDDSRTMQYIQDIFPMNAHYSQCGMVLNFFVGKTKAIIKHGGWDPSLKLGEHSAFFWRMQSKLRIAYTKEVIVDHHPIRDAKYMTYRIRGNQYFQQFLRANNMAGAVNFKKQVTINEQWSHERLLAFHGVSPRYKINPYFALTTYDSKFHKSQADHYRLAHEFMIQHKLDSVLDVGCGSGYKIVDQFRDANIVGAEIEPMLSFLHKEYPDYKWLDANDPTTFLGQYDLVICMNVIECLTNPTAFLNRLDSLDFKYIIFSTPDRTALEVEKLRKPMGPPNQAHHVREWSLGEFCDYVSIFFKLCNQIKSGSYQLVICEKLGYNGPFVAVPWKG